jgi:apolipoprotein N-acyltransferase
VTKRPFLLAAISGVLYGLAFPPTGIVGSLLAFFCLVPLLIAIESGTRLRDTFRRSFLSMLLLGLISNYWVGGWGGIGEVDPFLMMGGIILAIVHPFFLVIPLLLYDVIRRKYGIKPALYALPVIWTGFEFWHSLGDLGYPWLNLYNTQTYNTWYVQFIEFTGSYGLSFVIVGINVLIYTLLRSRSQMGVADLRAVILSPKGRAGAFAALINAFLLPYIFGAIVMTKEEEASGDLRVSIIQPNINPWEKWEAGQEPIMDSNYRSTIEALRVGNNQVKGQKVDLILWPETAIPFYITEGRNGDQMAKLESFLDYTGAALLTGFPQIETFEGDDIPEDAKMSKSGGVAFRNYNAAMLLYKDRDGYKQENYYKQKLVPLGEKVPFVDLIPVLGDWFKWSVGLGSWNTGTGIETQDLPLRSIDSAASEQDTAKLWTMICYESVYPQFVRQFVNNGAELLFVITNDGWYGKSSGPHQHNQFAMLRAVENRRWIARSANTGISAVIDDKGRFLEETDLFVKTSVTQNFPLLNRKTLYTQLGDFIAIPCMWITGGFTLFLLVQYYRTRPKKAKKEKGAK